jgi:hypothetical protein
VAAVPSASFVMADFKIERLAIANIRPERENDF